MQSSCFLSKWICLIFLLLSSRCPDTERLLITCSWGSNSPSALCIRHVWKYSLRLRVSSHSKCNLIKFTGFNITPIILNTHHFQRCHYCMGAWGVYIRFTAGVLWLKGLRFLKGSHNKDTGVSFLFYQLTGIIGRTLPIYSVHWLSDRKSIGIFLEPERG